MFEELMEDEAEDEAAKEARIKELEAQVHEARAAYYNGDPATGSKTRITDREFDALYDELQQLKADSPAITSIGAPLPEGSAWPKVEHQIPMGSLGKVQTIEEMSGWVQKASRDLRGTPIPYEELLITEKLDGISISVEYEKGKIVQALTRGDGYIGEDITPNVVKMKGILREISSKEPVHLRGEIVLRKDIFEEFFQGKANTRNAASGTAKRLDGRGSEHLSVYFYQVHGPDFTKDSDQFEWLEEQGFDTPAWYVTVMAPGAKTPQDIWVEYQQTVRDSLPYDIDGLVVRLNDMEYQLSLGETAGRPKGATAFKFAPVTRETTVVGLDIQVGGTGRNTPVAVLKPIRLLGAVVQRASLYNWAYIEQIKFHIGATVLVTRSNDVIPRVVSVTRTTGDVAAAPTVCPECGYELEQDGEYIVCPNTAECPAQIEGRLKKWVQELNILEWGDVLIEKVVKEGLATSVPDLYRITPARLAKLERMGPASAKKALETLWGAVPMPLEQFIGALGIPLCATVTVETVVSAGHDTIDKLKAATIIQLQEIPGMGPKRAKALHGWLARSGDLLDEMLDVGIEIKARITGSLSGKSFCFTGTMKQKRPVLKKMAKDAGAQVKESAAGATYLVIADPNSTTTKAKAARLNGTECISEEAFLEMIVPV